MKTPSTSLRRRIIKSSFVMTLVICLLFTGGLFVAFEFAEESLLEDHLEADMNTFMDHHMVVPEIATLPRENFSVYVAVGNDRSHFPEYLLNLPAGEEDVTVDGKLLDVEVRQRHDTSFYFVFEETSIASFEYILVVSVLVIVIIVCICSLVLAFGFADRIIRPVTELAQKVNRLENEGNIEGEDKYEGRNEVEVLSAAIDSYQHRVSELLAREREFSSDASHELRTPLMGIQAAAENIQIGEIDRRTRELAQRIEARCRQMQSLVDSMLYLARDPDSLENNFKKVSLLDVINDQIDAVSPHLEGKGIETLLINNGEPQVHTSEAILSVVFGNLLRNAVIHSQSREIHIEISSEGFSIKDFGQGIEPELRDRMFQRYANGNSEFNQGLGIGLSLVKRLCDHFNWGLAVLSGQETGTTITVEFGGSLVS